MTLNLDIIAILVFVIGLPLLLLAASSQAALCAIARMSRNGVASTHRTLTNCGWFDSLFAVVWSVGGLSALLVESFSAANDQRIAFFAALAAVGVVAAISANLKFKITARIKRADAAVTRPDIDREYGYLKQLVYVALFLGITSASAGIKLLVIIELVVALVLVRFGYICTKQKQESQLLWLLAIAIRNNENPADEIDEHAARFYGPHASNLRLLATSLRNGKLLGDALSKGKAARLLPPWVIGAIANGDKTGTLKLELEQLSTQFLNSIRSNEESSGVPRVFNYILLYGIAIPFICGYLFFREIVPKYQKIFEGFETELPLITSTLFAMGTFVSNYWYIFAALALWPVFWIIRIGLGRRDAWRNLQQGYLMWMFRRVDTPDILRRLARVIRADQPITLGLDSLSQNHQRRPIRKAMDKLCEHVQSGKDCWTAMNEAHFLSDHDLQLLKAAQRNHNLPWALDELAATRERHLAYRLQVAMQIVHPCLVITVGCVVGFIVVGFFMPTVKLLNDLS
jgi:type II secretory pathway component PulF